MSVKIILAIAVVCFAFITRVECRDETKATVSDSRATTTTGENGKVSHSQRPPEELPAAAPTSGSTALPVNASPVTKQDSVEGTATHSSIKRSLAENLARNAYPGCCG